MKLIWSPESVLRLIEIHNYISKDSPEQATRFVALLMTRVQKLTRFPNLGRKIPERESDELREILEGNYRIIYRIRKHKLEIVTVFEGHRLLKDKDLK